MFRNEALPWSFKAQVGFVLNFHPVEAGPWNAIQAEVASEMQIDNMVSRSLPNTTQYNIHIHVSVIIL